jgi:hypothetical protein
MATIKQIQNDFKLAQNQWGRYLNGLQRGHLQFESQAKLCENFYLGAGRQWDDDLRKELEADGKPALEENIIFSTVNTVLGYQTQSRMDIAYKPRETGDQDVSDILTKIGMYVTDQNKYSWTESQVFADGIIQSRGYFDVRMDFDDNLHGSIKITTLDPLDVMPDPNAKTYNPEDWADVIIAKWIPVDELKQLYGNSKAKDVATYYSIDRDWGDDGYEVQRNKFGNYFIYAAYYTDETENKYVRVLERQWKKLQIREFWYDINTGDYYPIPDDMKQREKNRIAKANGYDIIKKATQRIRWTVSTRDVVLHDDWSPYEHYTVVPYFPYFRRGVTIGLVDNLIKTQEMLNKVFSQILHVVNTTANSGWKVEQNSLVNMDVEDLENEGSKTGLVLEYKAGRNAPEKIEPNQIPTGLKDLVTTGVELIRMISGVSETFQGGKGPEVSGTAIQSRVHQAAIQLATPIDNLYRTRNILAGIILNLIQGFMTEERMLLVTSDSEDEEKEQLIINKRLSDGTIINDITVGKYDVVVADVPTQITFQNAQFSQALELRKYGVMIPDDEMVRMSTLSRKNEIAKKMSGEEAAQQQMQMQQEQFEKQMHVLEEQIEELSAKAYKGQAEALKTITEVAQLLQINPKLAPLIDSLAATVKQKEEAEHEEEQESETSEEMLENPAEQGNFSEDQQSNQATNAANVFV